MSAARLILFGVVAATGGVGLLSRLSSERRPGPALWGLGFFLGVLGTALWTHLLLITRVPVNLGTIALAPVLFAVAGRWKAVREAEWERPHPAIWIVAAAGAFILWGALSFSLPGFDPEVFYCLKAKSIVVHGTFWNEDFTDPARMHAAHRRPLLLPCIYADVYLATGSFDARLLRVWFALLQLGAFGGMYQILRSRVGRAEASVALAIYSWCPVLWSDAGGAVSAYADAPLSMCFMLALIAEAPLAIFAAMAGALLKDEGIAFMLPFALARGFRLAVIPGSLAVLWVAIASRLPRDGDFLPANFLHPYFSSLPLIFRHLFGEVNMMKHWGLLWLVILGVLAWKCRRLGRSDLRLLGPLGLQLMIYVGVWSTFPIENLRPLIRVEDMRLMFHLLPTAWVWAVWRAMEPDPAPEPGLPTPPQPVSPSPQA